MPGRLPRMDTDRRGLIKHSDVNMCREQSGIGKDKPNFECSPFSSLEKNKAFPGLTQYL